METPISSRRMQSRLSLLWMAIVYCVYIFAYKLKKTLVLKAKAPAMVFIGSAALTLASVYILLTGVSFDPHKVGKFALFHKFYCGSLFGPVTFLFFFTLGCIYFISISLICIDKLKTEK